MSRMLLRMERRVTELNRAVPGRYLIAGYRQASHHQDIPVVFGAAFDRKPWSSDWHDFDEFDPEGVFVALEEEAGSVVGFTLCFQRRDSKTTKSDLQLRRYRAPYSQPASS